MPYIQVNNANLYYEEHGSGPETIVFAHGLMWSGLLYEYQVAALKDHYRCITFDFRGQGKSQITQNGYGMDSLTGDAAAIIERLQAAPCHFAGLSMGGFVGIRLAIRYPHLLKSLILLETSADPEPAEKINLYRLMALVTRLVGTKVAANKVMPIMFGEKFLNDPERAELREKLKQRAISNNKKGIYRATKGVINRDGVYDQLEKINIPTLVIVGDQDVATPPSKSGRMHQHIVDSEMVVIPGAGHTSTVEEPEAVNDAIIDFLEGSQNEFQFTEKNRAQN